MLKYDGFTEATEEDLAPDVNKELDAIMAPLYTPQAVKALEYIKDTLVKAGIVNPNDTQFGVGLKQGNLDMILKLLSNAERVNNGR